MDWKLSFETLGNKKGQLISNLPKNATAAAFCCIFAAYRPKYCIMGLFYQKLHWMDKNSSIRTFCNKKDNYYKKNKKAPAAAHGWILAAYS